MKAPLNMRQIIDAALFGFCGSATMHRIIADDYSDIGYPAAISFLSLCSLLISVLNNPNQQPR